MDFFWLYILKQMNSIDSIWKTGTQCFLHTWLLPVHICLPSCGRMNPLIEAVGGGELITGDLRVPTQIIPRVIFLRGRVQIVKQKSGSFLIWCAVYELRRKKDTGLRHHPEDHSGITRGEQKKHEWELNFFPFPHSSVSMQLPESQQWSPDGAAKAGLIHVLLRRMKE